MGLILDGKKCTENMKLELKNKISNLESQGSRPVLAVVLVGENPASKYYVGMKEKMCNQLGITPLTYHIPEEADEAYITNVIKELNTNMYIDGILLQIPLPNHEMESRILEQISPEKDVDCLTSTNIGKMMKQDAYVTPCTPTGIIRLLDENNISIPGKNVVILGRSNIVGRPMAELFLQRDATVSIVHSHTDISYRNYLLNHANIIVSAMGQPRYIKPKMFNHMNLTDRILIDVGVSRVDGKVVGDFHEDCYDYATYYTPYTGGVGPMTVMQLMENVVKIAENRKIRGL